MGLVPNGSGQKIGATFPGRSHLNTSRSGLGITRSSVGIAKMCVCLHISIAQDDFSVQLVLQ